MRAQPDDGYRYCPHCGAELPAQAAFCPRCGRGLGPQRPAGSAPSVWLGRLSSNTPALAVGALIALLGTLAVALLVTGGLDRGGPLLEAPAGPSGSPRSRVGSRDTPDPPSPGALPASGAPAASPAASEPRRYVVRIEGRTISLPIDVRFAPREMPDPDTGETLLNFSRDGVLTLQNLATPRGAETDVRTEFALESGDWTLSQEAGMVQLVTNFGMWAHVTNGPRPAAEFPTQLAELEGDVAGWDLAWYIDARSWPALSVEAVPNLFIAHPSLTLRNIRLGAARVRFDDRGGLVGEVDLIGWAPTGSFPPTQANLAFSRYRADIVGELSP